MPVLDEESPFWACSDCGNSNQDYIIFQKGWPEDRIQCDICGSYSVKDIQDVVHQLVEERDLLIKRLKERKTDA